MRLFLFFLFFFTFSVIVYSQEETPAPKQEKDDLKVPEKVEVKPLARDQEIQTRLKSILDATGWFQNADVTVNEGVVFLTGLTKKEEYKKWAGDLARKTEDVAAVVNHIEVRPTIWDYSQAIETIRTLWRRIAQAFSSIVFGIMILVLAGVAAFIIATGSRLLLRKRIKNQLLRNVISKAIGLIVFLFGIYIVFEIAGLTAVAFTVIGGTGILGIILGIAFRDITENFLASIFLSIQNPFKDGDLIEIEGVTGFVQRLTMRATVLLSLEGMHYQIPNATIFKGKICNYTSNPKRRQDFIVGIDANVSISNAQDIILKVLVNHPAVLDTPEPWVLVDSLGKSTVNLRIYFWLNANKHDWLKVRSSVIRQTKKALQEHGIAMPDEARERIFPEGITVEVIKREHKTPLKGSQQIEEKENLSTNAESGLHNPAQEIQKEAPESLIREKGADLLSNNHED